MLGSGSTAAKLKALRWVPLAATDAAKSGVVPPFRRIFPAPVLCPTASFPGSNAADGGVRMRWARGGGPDAVDAETDDDDGAVEGPKSGNCSEMGGGGMGADAA